MSTMMRTARKSEIPEYLQRGELFRTLVENNDDPGEELTFPASVLKSDTSVNNVQDLNHLLSSMQFWAVDEHICQEVVDFVVLHHSQACADVLQNFTTAFPYVKCLRKIMVAESHRRVALAIQFGSMQILRTLDMWGGGVPPCPDNAGVIAAKMNRCDILAHVYNRTGPQNVQIAKIASSCGYADILRFLVEHGYELCGSDVDCAVSGGHLKCLEYVYATRPTLVTTHCMSWMYNSAVINGHLHILHFLLINNIKRVHGDDLVALAVRYGRLHCLKFLDEQGCPYHEETTILAAQNGHLNCLQYAVEHGCPMHPDTSHEAARYGKLDCLVYAHQHGSPINTTVWQSETSPISKAVQLSKRNPCRTYWYENVK